MEACSGEHVETWVALARASALCQDRLDEALKAEIGHTLAEHDVLVNLARGGGRARMGDVARGLVVSKSGATRLVAKLEAAGLIDREVPRDDRRATFAVLTDAGRARLAQAQPVFERTLAAVFAQHLAAGDVACLRAALDKLIAANGGCGPLAVACAEAIQPPR